MEDKKERLLSEFAPNTREEWMEKIITDLKGADFNRKLVWHTKEGFDLNPFYRLSDLEGLKTPFAHPDEFPYVRSTKMSGEWLIRQDLRVDDLEACNAKALDILGKGITSLGFKLKKTQINIESLRILLKGIYPEAVELNFTCCVSVVTKLGAVLTEYLEETGANLTQCHGSIEFDTFKKQLVRGISNPMWLSTCKKMIDSVQKLPKFRVLTVNALNLNNAGAYIYQELGYAMAWGTDILDQLAENTEYSIEEISSRIKFVFGISGNYFMELAKFRAARWLWAEIVAAHGKEYQGEASKIHQHAVTSTWNKTIYDAHVNLLRTQTEAMSATLGGVDSLTVQPFDITYQDSDNFSERIARNQQLLLKEEAHFDKVIDPAAGSYYIEHLTNSIAQEAWKLFLDVEDDGGFSQACESGKIQEAINTSNASRHEAVAKRREVLLGTNQYPNFSELALKKIKHDFETVHNCGCGKPTITPLNFSRGASDFEALRLATERSGKEIKVFMLTIGNLAMRLARSQFSANFFACAGYNIIDNLGFQTVEEGIDKAMEKQADVVVICSSDDEYADYAIPAYKYLNGRAEFVVAGAPACSDDLRKEGIENFINVKSNVLETLQVFNEKLGINK